MLYIVSTPIGNLKDITYRAVETLKACALIAAEDTRHTRVLSHHYGITTPMVSYYEHNKLKSAERILKVLTEGRDVALVTDSGTPGISDPGYHLIRLAIQQDIPVTAVPGPTAFIPALLLSGLPIHSFVFDGFLPVKSTARRKRLASYQGQDRTVVVYESPHRLVRALSDIADVLDDPPVACARELTKKFEEVRKGRAGELAEYFSKKKPRGEFVVLIDIVDK